MTEIAPRPALTLGAVHHVMSQFWTHHDEEGRGYHDGEGEGRFVRRQASRIAIFKVGVDPAQEAQYPELHRWMLETMDRFRAVFAARVRELSIIPALGAPDEEPPEE